MSFSVRVREINDPLTTGAGVLFAVVVCTLCALTLLSLASSVRTTVQYDMRWIGAYAVSLTVLLTPLGVSLYRRGATFSAGSNRMKYVYLSGGLAGFCVITAFAVFSGAPILLHHLTSASGAMTVTVAAKYDRPRKYTCGPRLEISEFTFFVRSHICPGEQAYRDARVGSRLRLEGDVSEYGISIERVMGLKHGQSRITREVGFWLL